MVDSNLNEPADRLFFGQRRWIIGIAVAMVLCIALAATFLPYFQYSVLYAIPLTLLACSGELRAMRWLTVVVLALAVLTYFPRYWLDPPPSGAQYLSFRLTNRVMVAGMLWLLSKVLGMWLEAEHYRHDPTWSDEFDRAHGQISAMLGMLIAMPTVVVVALADALSPGNFNLAVLYVVPLVTCAWVRSVRLLWTLCALLEVLAIGGLYWGPPPTGPEAFQRFLLSRVFNGVVMIIVAGLLHYWIRATQRKNHDRAPDPSDGAESPDGDDEQALAK